MSLVGFKFLCNILISGKIIKEMPGSVTSGTHCRMHIKRNLYLMHHSTAIKFKEIH